MIFVDKKELAEIRAKIDEIDSAVVKLISERLFLAKSLADKKLKKQVCDFSRELEVIKKVKLEAAHKEFISNIEAIYREIIEQSKKVQE